jgi:hypothetical protein
MNYYPGEGLGVGTAVLGGFVGQEYSTVAAAADLCKLYGVLKDIQGDPVGVASTALEIVNGTLTTVAIWTGVKILPSNEWMPTPTKAVTLRFTSCRDCWQC